MTVGASGSEQPKQSLLYSSWLHNDVSSKSDPFSELYNVLCPREGLLRGTTVLFTVQLGQLQHRHVAQGTHFPDFQPLNKALSVEGMLTRANPQFISRLKVF